VVACGYGARPLGGCTRTAPAPIRLNQQFVFVELFQK
jgi:hypothetical protein